MALLHHETELDNPELAPYELAERRAILVHKYYLGIELGYDPGMRCAVASWEVKHALRWRTARQHVHCEAQMAEIEHHRRFLTEREGHTVSWESAARDWIQNYAAAWRRGCDDREEQRDYRGY